MTREPEGTGEPALKGRHAALRLQRILRRDKPPDLIQVEPLQRLDADMAMAGMSGVEGTAENADPSRRQLAERPLRRPQGRT